MNTMYDVPEKDFRKRDWIPEIWVLDPNSHFGIEYGVYSQKIVNLIPTRRCKVLDAGCGCGRISALIAQKGHEVVSIDYSERPIEFAKMFVPEAKFYQVDLRELNKKDELQNVFDVTISVDVLEHIPPDYHQQVISNLAATLNGNGLLIIAVPSIHRVPINKWHYKHFTLDEIEGLLEQAGMEIKEIRLDHKVCFIQYLLLRMWRFVENKYWDLRFLRKSVLKPLYENFLANPADPSKAGRYIVVAQRKGILD